MNQASALFASAVKSAKKKAEYAKKKGEEGVKAAKEVMGVQSKGKSSKPSRSLSGHEFEVLLERTASCSNLGLQMASDDHGLYVNLVGEGLASDWNVCHEEDTQIKAGDRLLAVSSDKVSTIPCGPATMNKCLEVLKTSTYLHLKMLRAPVGTLASTSTSMGSSAQPNRSGTRAPKTVVVDDRAISGLCALGFSAAASKHALVRCGGNPNYAALWLEDAANADEIATAEMVADTEENELMASQVSENPAAFEGAVDGSLDDAPELRQELLEKLGVKPRQFSISIEKSEDKKLGLEMDSDTCEVLEVKEGLVEQWNSTNGPECHVQAGDVFVAIEGTDNSTAAMMTALMTESSLRITVQRLEDPYCLGSMSTGELHELLLNFNAQAAQELTKTGKTEVVDSSCCAADPNPVVETGLSAEQRAAMRAAAEQRFAIGEKNRRSMDDWRREQRALEQSKESQPKAAFEPPSRSGQEEMPLLTSMAGDDEDTCTLAAENTCITDKIDHSEVEPEEKTEVVQEKTPLVEDTCTLAAENTCINDKIDHSEVEPEEKTEVVQEKTPLVEDTHTPPAEHGKNDHSEVEPEEKAELVLEKTPLLKEPSEELLATAHQALLSAAASGPLDELLQARHNEAVGQTEIEKEPQPEQF